MQQYRLGMSFLNLKFFQVHVLLTNAEYKGMVIRLTTKWCALKEINRSYHIYFYPSYVIVLGACKYLFFSPQWNKEKLKARESLILQQTLSISQNLLQLQIDQCIFPKISMRLELTSSEKMSQKVFLHIFFANRA